jgi:hypothetical protein
MKKIIIFLLLTGILKTFGQVPPPVYSSIQSQTTTSPFFVKSMYNVYDSLTVPDNSVLGFGEDTVFFVIYSLIDVKIDSVSAKHDVTNQVWYLKHDMGSLPDTSSYIKAWYHQAGIRIDSSDRYDFTIYKTPDWILNGGSINNTNVIGDSVFMDAIYPLQIADQIIPSSVKFIGGLKVGFPTKDFNFKTKYSLKTGEADVTDSLTTFMAVVNAFDYFNTPPFFLTTHTSGSGASIAFNLGFDTLFNLKATAKFSFSRNIVDWESLDQTFPIPPCPIMKMRFGAGFKLDGGIGGRLIYGKDGSGRYGLIGNINTDSTSSDIAVGMRIEGSIRGGIDLVSKHICGITGKLTAVGRLGLDYRFITEPAPNSGLFFGGDLMVKGTIKLEGAGGWIARNIFNFEQYTGKIWPRDTATYRIKSGFPSAIHFGGFRLINPNNNTFQASWEDEVNYQTPSPHMDARNSDVKTVWIEEDSAAHIQYLLLSRLDSSSCGNFSSPKIVTSGGYALSNPKISSFKNGDAIITWTQNRYNEITIPASTDSTSFEKFIDGQDILFAIYQNSNDSIIYIGTLSDPSNSRAEGEATVTAGKGTNAIITWPVEDPAANTTDIYYVAIDNTAGNWTILNAPAKIFDLSGNNFDVNVCYVDSVNAVAVWIHDADALDTIPNNEIVSYLWNGTSWNQMTPSVASIQPNVSYEHVSLDINSGYAAVVYTARNYVDTGIVYKTVQTKVYNNALDKWPLSADIIDADTITNFNLPKISISDSGIVAVTYQSVDIFTDTIPDQGQINLLVNNLSAYTPIWQKLTNQDLKYVCDTNTFVWDMTASFGNNGVLYLLTQEADTLVGGTYTPVNGSVFGDPELGMVVRTVKVFPNLTIKDEPAPCSIPTGIKQHLNQMYTEPISAFNFPNPATDYTIFEYIVKCKCQVKIEILDLQGKLIETPANQVLGAGKYRTLFYTNNLSNGVYIYRVTMDNYSVTKKLIIAK